MFQRLALALGLFVLPVCGPAEPLDYRAIQQAAAAFPIRFDTDYELTHNRLILLHFQITLPRADDLVQVREDYSDSYFFAAYSFFAPDGTLAEYVTISTLTIAAGSPEERAESLAAVMFGQIVPSLSQQEMEQMGARNTLVAGRPALEFVGLYQSEDYGEVAARIVGIFAPAGEHVLVFISQTVTAQMPLANADDLAETFAGRLAESTIFIGGRDAGGIIQAF